MCSLFVESILCFFLFLPPLVLIIFIYDHTYPLFWKSYTIFIISLLLWKLQHEFLKYQSLTLVDFFPFLSGNASI